MHGDFDRVTFDPTKRFADVLIQQGRLLLSADWNERGAIYNHFLRMLIVDLVGRHWRAGGGFTIGNAAGEATISKGHYYIDGILCENPSNCSFADQPYGPIAEEIDALKKASDGQHLAFYLDCWERHVTSHLDPTLSDVALGGLDAATRVQIAWQARVLNVDVASRRIYSILVALNERKLPAKGDAPVTPGLPKTIEDALEDFRKSFDAGGKPDYKTTQAVLDVFDDAPPRLAAFDKPPDKHADPCAIPPDSAYRGRENQLYRVEVHRGGLPTGKPDGPTFKWSRENGAVTFKVLMVEPSTAAGGGAVDKRTMVTVESLGHDRRTGLCVGDWIELIDFPREFERAAKPLLQIEKIDQQRRRLTLIGAPGDIDTGHPVLARRWDHTPDDDKEGTCLINESNDDTGWIELERGVFIRFAPGGLYDTGQYWLIPARVATGRVEWPEVDGAPASLAPHGVLHHRATLGIAKKSSGAWDFDGTATGYSHEPFAGL